MTPEQIEKLRRARAAAKAQWQRNQTLARIEESLRREGYDTVTTHVTMHHLYSEFLDQLAREERMFRYGGALVVLAGVAVFVVTLIGDLMTGFGFSLHWFAIAFGVLLIARGYWLRARIRLSRNHRWMSEMPADAGDQGGSA